jgi:hypothetical protein
MKNIFLILLSVSIILLSGCQEDYLERVPTASVTEADLFAGVLGSATALQGIHRATFAFYGAHDKFGQKAVDMAMDLLGEDMFQSERGYGWFVSWYQYIDHRNINSTNLEYVWEYYYDLIDNANVILVNIDKANDLALNQNLANNVKAQALVYRAYSHFQVVQLYADRYVPGGANSHLGIPIMTEPSQEGKARSTVAQVYTQIKKDLDDAITLFGQSTTTRANKSEININVAKGIKARVALTTGEWATAATMAAEARTGFALTTNYAGGWNKATDSEWMWGAVLIDEQQTSYASFFSHIDPNFGGYAALGNHKLASTTIFNFMSDTDVRKSLFRTNSGKPRVGFKFSGFGQWTNDYLYMKSGEMFLIEAEALARQGGKDAEAQTAIFNLVSKRDPNYVKPTLTGNDLIEHILMQRRCDLWGDGFRFLDLKRLNLPLERRGIGHNESLWNAASNYPAGDKNFVFLIPKQEIDANPNMVQNPL